MQSLRQYKALRTQVAVHIETGNIVNLSSAKTSVLDDFEENAATSTIHSSDSEQLASSYPNQEPIIVGWEGPDDPLNPRNWTMAGRCFVFAILWINVFAVDWASSADSQVGSIIAKQFHIADEVESLSSSLYTFGIACGALLAGPISETVGRNPIYVISRIFHVAWLVGAALAPNAAALFIFRFFAGFSGSILLAIHAASTADLFGPVHRTIAWPVIALASFWGTSFAPIPGAWIAQTGVNWRWAEWIAVLLSGSTLILTLLFLPETFSPILLSWRAKHLRELTKCDRFKAELDLQLTIRHRFAIALTRAFHMLTREPIVLLLGGWLVVEDIVVFGFLQGFNYVFGDTYGFSRGLIGTSFATIGVGTALWTLGIPFYYHAYKKKVGSLHEKLTGANRRDSLIRGANLPGQDLPDPEYRLWSALLAAPAFPIALFWLGWTNYVFISPWSSLGAVALLGFSWAGIYVTVYQYLLDTYGIYSGSALAIVTCWRYVASGAINLISRPMYNGIGVHWTATLLGCLAALQTPLPLIFYFFGERIRAKSSFASRYARKDNPRDRVGKASAWK